MIRMNTAKPHSLIGVCFLLLLCFCATVWADNTYPWLAQYDAKNTIAARIPVPKGFTRIEVEEGTFADWLPFPLLRSRSGMHLCRAEPQAMDTRC